MIHVLFSEKQIADRIAQLGKEIRETCKDESPLRVIVLLNGAMIFAADLIRAIQLPDMQYDSYSASSYQGILSVGKVKFRDTMKMDVKGCNILLVDDILDSGLTMKKTVDMLKKRGAAKIRTCVLLDKNLPNGEKKQFAADWTAFFVENKFVVGFGLDLSESHRQLPYVGYLEEEPK